MEETKKSLINIRKVDSMEVSYVDTGWSSHWAHRQKPVVGCDQYHATSHRFKPSQHWLWCRHCTKVSYRWYTIGPEWVHLRYRRRLYDNLHRRAYKRCVWYSTSLLHSQTFFPDLITLSPKLAFLSKAVHKLLSWFTKQRQSLTLWRQLHRVDTFWVLRLVKNGTFSFTIVLTSGVHSPICNLSN